MTPLSFNRTTDAIYPPIIDTFQILDPYLFIFIFYVDVLIIK